jgi:hypothetical protein
MAVWNQDLEKKTAVWRHGSAIDLDTEADVPVAEGLYTNSRFQVRAVNI